MMEVVKGRDTEAVARAIGRYTPELEPYVLKDISEIQKNASEGQGINAFDGDLLVELDRGSDARVITLDLRGTKCVGKILHPIFFEPGTIGMQYKLEKFFKEIKLLSEINHPNIVKFLGIYYKQFSSLSFELPVLVMERMEFSVDKYLSTHEKGSISNDKVVSILLDVSRGLVYLHEKTKVAHRDLSSNNILFAADLSAKIADLGAARVLDRPGGWASESMLTIDPGTTHFMPPEALEDPPKYTVSVDVFSFGCVIIHLCTHKWPAPIGKTAQGKIISEFERRQKYIIEMDNLDLLPIVKQCLEELSENRPTSSHVELSLENIMRIIQYTKQCDDMLQQYILKDVREIPGDVKGKEHKSFKMGSYAKEMNLKFKDTHCVGQVLDTSLFDLGIDPSRTQSILEKLFREIQQLSKLKYPNIAQFIGIFYRQDSSLPVLVMEKMEYTLTKYLRMHKKGSIPEDKGLNILLDVAKGLVYLHEEMKVTHGDLSSNNILLTAGLSAKIADLGSARVLDRPGGWSPLPVKPDAMHFMPPEVLEDPPEYTTSVDVFSFGCVIIHLNTHKWPSPDSVSKEWLGRQKYISEMANSDLRPIVLHCLEALCTKRPTSRDIMSSLQGIVAKVTESDLTIVLIGATGCGKSAVCNFFAQKNVFLSKWTITPVTKCSQCCVVNIGGISVKFVDTPGLLNGLPGISIKDEVLRFIKHNIDITGRFHALGIVFDIEARYSFVISSMVETFQEFRELIPYTFVIFSHATCLGETSDKQDLECKRLIFNAPENMKKLLRDIKGRYISLEAVRPMEQGYFHVKALELVKVVQSINKENNGPFLASNYAPLLKKYEQQEEQQSKWSCVIS